MRPRTRLIFIGMKHGHLTVVREVGLNKYRQTVYECVCECGGLVQMRTAHFTPERRFCTRNCALLQKHRVVDLIGKRFGRWQVQSCATNRGHRKRLLWNCVCDCGSRDAIYASALLSGMSSSCGCLAVDLKTKDYTPQERLELRRESSRLCARNNPARVKNNKIKYESKLKRATPGWLTKEDWDYMNALYEEARRLTRETGVKHQVDHIIPINGRTVSGLHVPGNLQILTQAENVAKLNRYAELSGD